MFQFCSSIVFALALSSTRSSGWFSGRRIDKIFKLALQHIPVVVINNLIWDFSVQPLLEYPFLKSPCFIGIPSKRILD